VPSSLAPVRRVLDHGVIVLAAASPATPAVAINATVQAGGVFDPPGLPGVAHLVARVLDRGTATRPAERIAEDLDDRGVTLSISVNRHVLTLACTCLSEDFEAVLAIVGDVLEHPVFPGEQVALRRAELVTAIRQDEDSPAAMAGEGLLRLLYPGHPYAVRPRGTVESVSRTSNEDLRAFHRARFAPSALSLAVVGDVEPSWAVEQVERILGRWSAPAPSPPDLPPVARPSARQRLVLPMMDKAQADVAYGFTTITRSDPEYYAYWLMNHVLGQYALGGRLGDSIRERQGMAYYVFSALDANVVPGPLVVRAGVSPGNVDRAIASIDEEVAAMAREGPTAQELEASKRYLVGSLPRALETNPGIASFLQMVELFDLGLDYDRRLPDLLERVTREEAHAAARRVLDPGRAAVVVAGPYGDRLG